MTEPTNLPAVREEQHSPTPEGDLEARRMMAETCNRFSKDRQNALALLERVDRGLWAAALAGSQSAELARRAYEEGVLAFLRRNQYAEQEGAGP